MGSPRVSQAGQASRAGGSRAWSSASPAQRTETPCAGFADRRLQLAGRGSGRAAQRIVPLAGSLIGRAQIYLHSPPLRVSTV